MKDLALTVAGNCMHIFKCVYTSALTNSRSPRRAGRTLRIFPPESETQLCVHRCPTRTEWGLAVGKMLRWTTRQETMLTCTQDCEFTPSFSVNTHLRIVLSVKWVDTHTSLHPVPSHSQQVLVIPRTVGCLKADDTDAKNNVPPQLGAQKRLFQCNRVEWVVKMPQKL